MSARRPRSGGRRLTKAKECYADDDTVEKGKQKKRKLSDLLGPFWTGDELKIFYGAYRRHGRDWKKVAGLLQNRTVEMVEALYIMNKAYLSLQEGAASVAGLIAMMTDHYSILEQSRSAEDDSGEEVGIQNKSIEMQASKPRASAIASGFPNIGGRSPLKRPRTEVSRPRAVGKRTPRVALMQFQERKGYARNASIKVEDGEQDSFGDCDEVQVAMTLAATASQKAASPQISRTPACRKDRSKGSPAQNRNTKENRLRVDSGGSGTRHTGSNMDDAGNQGSEESKDTENGVVTKANTSVAKGRRKITATEAASGLRRNGKSLTKRAKTQGLESDDLKEECSCTDEGIGKREDVKGVNGFRRELSQKKKRPLSQNMKKSSRQLFSGDERSGLDALATLADLSLNGLPLSPRLGSEAGVAKASASNMFNWTAREGLSSQVEESYGPKLPKGHLVRLGNGKVADSDVQKAKSHAEPKNWKKRGSAEKRDCTSDSHNGDLKERIGSKAINPQNAHGAGYLQRRTALPHTLLKNSRRPAKQIDDAMLDYSSDVQQKMAGKSDMGHEHVADLTVTVAVQNNKGRRALKKVAGHSGVEKLRCPHATSAFGRSSNKVRLIHCLSSDKVRQWCTYEWFYSAIDLPWFSRNEFVEYLNHAGLGHVPRLTRVEWGVIRGSLGKPRRLSKRFLQEEREKLDMYRDSVRKHYQEVRIGHRDGLPTDLPRPLTVGQRVVARHPKTKEVYDGSVLTVDLDKCRVQFDRPEMGVELVADIDCMPVNSLENLSDLLKRKSIVESATQSLKVSVPSSNGGVKPANERGENFGCFSSSASYFLNVLCNHAQAADTVDSVLQVKAAANEAVAAEQEAMQNQHCTLAHVQAREADVRALADLTRALDKKEALLLEIRNMNNDADHNITDGDSVDRSDMFQKQYATLILQLKDVNKQVCEALLHLRQRNKYQDNVVPPWHRLLNQPTTIYMNTDGFDGNSGLLEQSPLVREVSVYAKHHAKLMVNTAVEAMFSVKEGEDALLKIGNALNLVPKLDISVSLADESRHEGPSASAAPSTCQVNSTTIFIASDSNNVDYNSVFNTGSDSIFPIDLMSSCIAALLMVQAFTEKHFPPAEVAMTLDSVLASLQPCSSQNYPIYTEIQHYAKLLKNQVIALIPTHCLPIDCPSTPN